jgi:hypothetical protein
MRRRVSEIQTVRLATGRPLLGSPEGIAPYSSWDDRLIDIRLVRDVGECTAASGFVLIICPHRDVCPWNCSGRPANDLETVAFNLHC